MRSGIFISQPPAHSAAGISPTPENRAQFGNRSYDARHTWFFSCCVELGAGLSLSRPYFLGHSISFLDTFVYFGCFVFTWFITTSGFSLHFVFLFVFAFIIYVYSPSCPITSYINHPLTAHPYFLSLHRIGYLPLPNRFRMSFVRLLIVFQIPLTQIPKFDFDGLLRFSPYARIIHTHLYWTNIYSPPSRVYRR